MRTLGSHLYLEALFYIYLVTVSGHLTALLRSMVIGMLGRNGHDPTVNECRKRFEEHCAGTNEIPADLRGAVYGTVIANGNVGDLVAMIELYRKTDHQEEKVRLMRCMGGSEDKIMIERALSFAMSVRVFVLFLIHCRYICQIL